MLRDGTRLTAPPGTPRGDTDRPLDDAEIDAKFHEFAGPVWGRAQATEIAALCTRFDTLDRSVFSGLLDLLLTAPPPR